MAGDRILLDRARNTSSLFRTFQSVSYRCISLLSAKTEYKHLGFISKTKKKTIKLMKIIKFVLRLGKYEQLTSRNPIKKSNVFEIYFEDIYVSCDRNGIIRDTENCRR